MLRIAALLVALALAAPAQAQYFLKDLQTAGLGKAEWRAMGAAAQTLYSPTVAADGATAPWTTAGAAGTVTLAGRQVRADGSTCVLLQHRFTTAQSAEAKEVRSRRCQQPNGTWAFSTQ